MALILERLDARRGEVQRRMMLERVPLTIGRALDNDLVIDDPHVDAHHARITTAEDGTLLLEDLGSVNGIDVPGVGRQTRVSLVAGTSVKIGRTPLRVRDRAESVVPAVPLAPPPTASAATGWLRELHWQLILVVVLLIRSADAAWVTTYTRDASTVALTLVVGVAAMLAIWAGGWAIVGKLAIRRASFLTHVAIASAGFLVMGFAETANGWGQFLFPGAAPVLSGLNGLFSVVVSFALIDLHLAYSTSLPRRKRWIGVGSVVGGIALLVAAFAAVKDDAFTDVPTFTFGLKRAPAAIIPADDLEGFSRAAAALRVKVDSLKPRRVTPSGDAPEN
jgi:hypothetical protein